MTKDWHLKSWMALAQKRQADLIKDLGWSRRKASEVYNGDQSYKREIVNEVADWLQVEPYELLMAPDDALQLRQLRSAAFAIAATHGTSPGSPAPPKTSLAPASS